MGNNGHNLVNFLRLYGRSGVSQLFFFSHTATTLSGPLSGLRMWLLLFLEYHGNITITFVEMKKKEKKKLNHNKQ